MAGIYFHINLKPGRQPQTMKIRRSNQIL